MADWRSHLPASLSCTLNPLTPFSSLGIFGWGERPRLPGRSACALSTGRTQRSQSVTSSARCHAHTCGLFKGLGVFTGRGGADAVFLALAQRRASLRPAVMRLARDAGAGLGERGAGCLGNWHGTAGEPSAAGGKATCHRGRGLNINQSR